MGEIEDLRKQLEMDPRDFDEDELVGDDALQDRIEERDELADRLDRRRHLQPLIDELRKKFNTRDDADKLADEIQDLRSKLDMDPREFTEEELNAQDAVPKLTKERDELRDELNRRNLIGDLPEEIQRLRKILGYKPRIFPDPIPLEMVPELEEERDGL